MEKTFTIRAWISGVQVAKVIWHARNDGLKLSALMMDNFITRLSMEAGGETYELNITEGNDTLLMLGTGEDVTAQRGGARQRAKICSDELRHLICDFCR